MIVLPILAVSVWGTVVGTLKVLMVISALLLILMVLFQDSKGGGLEAAFGGGGVGVSGPGSNRRIIRMTSIMAAVFLGLVVVTGLVERYTLQASSDVRPAMPTVEQPERPEQLPAPDAGNDNPLTPDDGVNGDTPTPPDGGGDNTPTPPNGDDAND